MRVCTQGVQTPISWCTRGNTKHKKGGRDQRSFALMRPDMYFISSFHSWKSSGRLTTRLAMRAPAGTCAHMPQLHNPDTLGYFFGALYWFARQPFLRQLHWPSRASNVFWVLGSGLSPIYLGLHPKYKPLLSSSPAFISCMRCVRNVTPSMSAAGSTARSFAGLRKGFLGEGCFSSLGWLAQLCLPGQLAPAMKEGTEGP